jgi:rhodanese-related sulfurtransferase
VDKSTLLMSLKIPQLEMVLDEIFNIPPSWLQPQPPRPVTVGELAYATRQGIQEVVARLRKLEDMSEGIEISPAALQERLKTAAETPSLMGEDSSATEQKGRDAPLLLLDVRQSWEYAICHLPGSILLTETVFAELLPRLRAADTVVTICHHGVRSLSAAFFLREQGVKGAVSLSGGLDRWAIEIDLGMARY